MGEEQRGLRRRGFLATGAAALAGGAFAAGRQSAPDATEPARMAAVGDDLSTWPAVARQFAAPAGEVHLDGFVLAVPPAPVRRAVDAHRRAFDRDGIAYLYSNELPAEQAVLAAAAEYLDTEPDLIALTDSTSMGLGLVYGGALLEPGDELLTTTHDFYATHEAMRFAAQRTGATVRKVALYDDPEQASAEAMAERLAAAVSDATRIVGITWVHSSSGVKLPIREIADRLGKDRPLLVVDGVHGFGVEATPVARLGCDLLATGCHKWLYGPRGTGLVWGRPAAWEALAPVIPSFAPEPYLAWMQGHPAPPGRFAWGPTMTPGGFHSFDQRWALEPAFRFHLELGRERVQERIAALAEQLKRGLAEIDGVRLRTPLDPSISAGIVCFELERHDPDDAVARLRERGVRLSVTPYATRYLRAGAPLWVDEAGIERALAEIARLARS